MLAEAVVACLVEARYSGERHWIDHAAGRCDISQLLLDLEPSTFAIVYGGDSCLTQLGAEGTKRGWHALPKHTLLL